MQSLRRGRRKTWSQVYAYLLSTSEKVLGRREARGEDDWELSTRCRFQSGLEEELIAKVAGKADRQSRGSLLFRLLSL